MTTPDLFDSPNAPANTAKAMTLREYIRALQDIADEAPTALDLPVMKWLPSSGAVAAHAPKVAHLWKVEVLGNDPRSVPRFWHPSDGLHRMGTCVIKV